MLRILTWLVGVDLLLAAVSILLERSDWLINTQIAFVSSALVLGASMFSYSQMIYRRLSSGDMVPGDDRDTLDLIEDPHDLYVDNRSTIESPTLKETIQEEKQHMKQHRRSLYQVLKDSKASLSFMRLGAYLLLFVGFFYLSRNQLLHIPSYLLGLALPIVIIVGLLLTQKEAQHETRL